MSNFDLFLIKYHGLYNSSQSFPKIGNYGQFQLRDLIIPFEKGLSKLSENHKIIVIRPTELKLWPFKDALLYADYMNTVY